MADEAVTPAEPETVNVTDVDSASTALEGLLDFGDTPEQPESDDAVEEQQETEVTVEDDTEVEVVQVADDGDVTEEVEVVEHESDEEPVEVYEVTLPGGERAEVTLEELTRGYSRQSDYTRKTEDLAVQRRELAAEREKAIQAVEAERQQYANRLAELGQAVGVQLQEDQNIDWDTLKEEDPIEFAAKWADHQRKVEQYRASQEELGRLQAEHQAKAAEQHRAVLAQQSQKLVEAMPDFADEEKAEKIRGDIRTFLKSNYGGFTDNEIGSVVDARHVQLIHDAMQWRNLQSSKTVTTKKVQTLPKVVKPSAQKAKVDNEAEQRAAKMKRAKATGHINDAAAALVDLL